MIQHGSKYKELFQDLNTLADQNGFVEQNRAILNWGTFETTFHQPSGYFDLYFKAWIRLTNEVGSFLILALIVAMVVSVMGIVVAGLSQ